jgi:hypothetical protein
MIFYSVLLTMDIKRAFFTGTGGAACPTGISTTTVAPPAEVPAVDAKLATSKSS